MVRKVLLSFCYVIPFISFQISLAEIVVFQKANQVLDATYSARFIYDSTEKMTLDKVVLEAPKAWKPLPSPVWFPNVEGAYWLSITVNNTTGVPIYLTFPYPFINKIDVYVQQNDSFQLQSGGFIRPFCQRSLPLHKHNFALESRKGPMNIIVRLENNWSTIPKIELATAETLFIAENDFTIFQGIYVGIMLGLFLYNFILFINIKERVFGFYLLYLISIFLISFHHSGLTCKYLWPCNSWEWMEALVNNSPGPTIILFAISFLKIKEFVPWVYRILIGIFILYLPYFILFQFPVTHIWIGQILEVINSLMPFILLWTSIYIYVWKKYSPAKFYIAGWSVFLISSVFLFRIYGGQLDFDPILFLSIEMGSASEALLFSFALADRITVLRKEKKLAEEAKREKQKELELQALVNERKLLETEIKTQELERARIAADLHDELGLTLSLAKMAIQQTESTLSKDYIQQAKQNVDISIVRLREITHNLHPSIVNTFGLASVIRRTLDNMASKYPFKITHYININISLPAATEVLVYRVFTELINNVIKHANASQLDVKFNESEEGGYHLIVSDNGVGIPKDTLLRSIQARMKLLKGNYSISERKGSGSQITISFPKN